jgi:hypothetical protein
MAAYDLAALWEAHCRYEFETRDVDATMSTMVAEPYVNHIPTMTGGVGFAPVRSGIQLNELRLCLAVLHTTFATSGREVRLRLSRPDSSPDWA